MTAQYEILRPFITDRVRELVRGRLLQGLKFFDTHTLRPEYARDEVKLALLLVRMANPREVFSKTELDLLDLPLRRQRPRAR